jgi:hypothetical protein
MSKFFTFTPRPDVDTFNISVRLDDIAAMFTTVHKSYDEVTKTEERKRPFLQRLFKDRSTRTETVEVTEKVRYEYYKICVSDRMTEKSDRHLVIAQTRNGKLADVVLTELRAALEAS